MSAYGNSARGGPLGAANKQELFTSARSSNSYGSGANANAINNAGNISQRGGGGVVNSGAGVSQPPTQRQASGREESRLPTARDRVQSDYPGLTSEEDDPLQLEHMLGYSGNYRRTVLTLPNRDNYFVKSMGSLISIQSLSDCHDQRLLRGHDMQVTVLAVSPSGQYIASGQIGTKHFKGDAAPIFVWDTDTGERVCVLKGLSVKVNIIAFSTDEKFICASGEDLLLYIWDVNTGEVVYGRRLQTRLTVLSWIEHINSHSSPYTSYQLALGLDTFLHRGMFVYEPQKVQWQLSTEKYMLPPGGSLVREFTCIATSADLEFVYVGTTGGEMLVLMRRTNVFRAIIPVCSSSLTCIAVCANEEVICSGGDGSLTKVQGRDMAWRVVMQSMVDSTINTISITHSQNELLSVCTSGCIRRHNVGNFSTQTIVTDAHTSPVRCIVFIPDSTMFVTGTAAGEVRSWDIIDYACQYILQLPKSGCTLSLCTVDNTYLLSGWEDGFIRCHDLATLSRQFWCLNAHRNGVTSLSVTTSQPLSHQTLTRQQQQQNMQPAQTTLKYFVSGGGEGTVRVWRLDTREQLTQHSEHARAVCAVLVDNTHSHIVHSASIDGSLLSFNLQTNRRIISHLSNGTNLFGLTQRKDSENECVSCDSVGRLLFWDVDYREAVLSMQDPARTVIRCVQVSPSGKYLAFAGDDQLLKVLELASGRVLSLGQGHSHTINALTWTPDEKQIVTAGEDSCLCVWNFYLGGV